MIHGEPVSLLNTRALKDAGTIVGDLKLNDLRCFFEVARQKNVAKAAKNLNMGQKDILQAIQALEDSIGTRLLDCDSKGTRVTEAGELFHRHAAPGVTQLEHATSLLNPECLAGPTHHCRHFARRR